MSNVERSTRGLVVIARNAREQIVMRITSQYELAGALRTACSILRLKVEAVGVEIHTNEGPTSTYSGKPLAVISRDDLTLAPHEVV